MQERITIIDGYNAIHRVPQWERLFASSLQAARQALIRFCVEWRSMRRDVTQFWVIFDGDSSVLGGNESAPGVKAVYTHTGETADARIDALLSSARGSKRYTVVTDDNEVKRSARRNGAEVMSVRQFHGMLRRQCRIRAAHKPPEPDKHPLPAKIQRQINESLIEELGIE